jgi:hypothetical protein
LEKSVLIKISLMRIVFLAFLHFVIAALPKTERYRNYYKPIEIGYAWITGMRTYMYWENTTVCFNRITNETYIGLP